MQIWRMKPDGKSKEQLTDDEYQNWFPHLSPDGKWMAFLSYLPDVKADDHPFYKHIYLRLMPAGGGKPLHLPATPAGLCLRAKAPDQSSYPARADRRRG